MCLTVQRLVAAGAYLPFIRHASHFLEHGIHLLSSCMLCTVMQAVQPLNCIDHCPAEACWLQGPAHTGAILQGESSPVASKEGACSMT
jgi:hypothetical protein